MAETVGWLADKLSIVELKLYHMREQAAREDRPDEFRAACRGRVAGRPRASRACAPVRSPTRTAPPP